MEVGRKISRNFLKWGAGCSMRTGRRTDRCDTEVLLRKHLKRWWIILVDRELVSLEIPCPMNFFENGVFGFVQKTVDLTCWDTLNFQEMLPYMKFFLGRLKPIFQ